MVATLLTLALGAGAKLPVTLRLESVARTYKVGTDVAFRDTIRNETNIPLMIVPQGDSMQGGRKAPYCQIQVKNPSGKWIVPRGAMGCGNTNPITTADFARLGPHKTASLLGDMAWSKYDVMTAFQKPGTYQVRLSYDTTPDLKAWIGGPLIPEEAAKRLAEVQGLYDQVPKGVFISNVVTVKITE